jgi:hypothetical protein
MHTGGEREDQSKAKNGLRIGRLRVVSASTAIQELSWALDQGSRFVTGCHAASLDKAEGQRPTLIRVGDVRLWIHAPNLLA